MSPYLLFKIISLVVMAIILVIVLANKKADKQSEADCEAGDSEPDENKEVAPAEEPTKPQLQDQVDYKAVHDEIYYVEYKLIPHFVEMFNEQPDKASQIIISVYENLVTLQNHLRKVNPYAFGKVSCEICGNIESECLAVYEFPKPFDMPLAKYGAIYINVPQQKSQYWTLEFSLKGKYVLGSKTLDGHVNYGQRPDLSKEEFIQEVCRSMGVSEASLQTRNMITRKFVLELDDRTLKKAQTDFSYFVACFYDFNPPSQMLLPALDKVAQEYTGKIPVGIYDVYGGMEQTSAPEDYSITALPTILFFANGKVVNRHVGVCGLEDLRVLIDELFNKAIPARP